MKQIFIGIGVLGLPLALTAYGYTVNETGFQGLLNHPQTLGVFSGMCATLFFVELISAPQNNFRNAMIFVLWAVIVIMTESRTGGLAFVLSVLGMFFISVVFLHRKFTSLFPGAQKNYTKLLLLFGFVGMVLFSSVLIERLTTFLLKRGDSSEVVEAYQGSRGQLIENSLENVRKFPMSGIGFGVPSSLSELEVTKDPFFNLPISAPTEKGVIPISALEELGLFGYLILLAMLLVMFLSVLSTKSPIKIAVFLSLVFINMGESIFFSPGGTGLLVLVLTGWCLRNDSYLTKRTLE